MTTPHDPMSTPALIESLDTPTSLLAVRRGRKRVTGEGATPARPRVVIYCRISDDDNNEVRLDVQEAEGRAWCEEQGYQIVRVIVEPPNTSATNWWRKGFQQALQMFRKGEADIFAARKVDRVCRNANHMGALLTQVETEAGGKVLFWAEKLEDTAIGRAGRNLAIVFADYEREMIAGRIRTGKQSRVARGKPLIGATTCFGLVWNEREGRYNRDDNPNYSPTPAAIIERIFTDLYNGVSGHALARNLDRDGLVWPAKYQMEQTVERTGAPWKRPAGMGWSKQTVSRIVANPIYMGQATAYRHKVHKEVRRDEEGLPYETTLVSLRDEDDPEQEPVTLEGIAPQLVSPEVWYAVHERMKQNKLMASRNNTDPEAALLRGGFLRCGYCGSTMAVTGRTRKDGTRTARYACHQRKAAAHVLARECSGGRFNVACHVIDPDVWAQAVEVLSNRQLIAEQLRRKRAERARADDAIAATLHVRERELARLHTQRQNFLQAIGTATIPSVVDLLTGELQKTERAIAQAELELDATRELLKPKPTDLAAEALLRRMDLWAKEIEHNAAELSYEEKREVLRSLRTKVTVYRGEDVPEGHPRWMVEFTVDGIDGLEGLAGRTGGATDSVRIQPRFAVSPS